MPFSYDGITGNITTEGPLVVTGASNTNPITITVSGSLPAEFFTGAVPYVDISAVQGNTNANGQWAATPTGASTFTIPQVGNAAYTSGGSVQPLYLKSFFTIPSDGDNDNSASIFPSLETLGDRTQWLASRTGAYKLVTSQIIGFVNDTTCVNPGISATVVSSLTDTSFGGGVGGGAVDPGHPFAVTAAGVISGDLIRVSLTATTSNNWPGAAQISLWETVYFPGTLPTGGLAPYQKIPYSGFTVGTFNIPISINCQFVAGQTGILGILPVLRVPTTTGTYQLWGDFLCSAQVWRPTGMPQ